MGEHVPLLRLLTLSPVPANWKSETQDGTKSNLNITKINLPPVAECLRGQGEAEREQEETLCVER